MAKVDTMKVYNTPFSTIFSCALVGVTLSACAPAKPTMDVTQAQNYCRGKVSKPVDTRVHLGVGIGSGGKVRSNSGVQIGVNVDSLLSPDATYEKCVQRNAGVSATEPYRTNVK